MKDKEIIAAFDVNKIDILSVRVIKANLETSASDEKINEKVNGFKFSWNIDTGLDIQEKLARLVINVEIEGIDSNELKLEISGNFSIEFVFRVENLEDFIIDINNEKAVHGVLSSNLLGITFSTSRGILLTRLNGTLLEGAILPIISPQQIVEQSNTLN